VHHSSILPKVLAFAKTTAPEAAINSTIAFPIPFEAPVTRQNFQSRDYRIP